MAGFHHIDHDTTTGTVGGTLLAIAFQLDATDMVRTMLLAAVGAIASFVVSHLCKWLWMKAKARFKRTRSNLPDYTGQKHVNYAKRSNRNRNKKGS